MCKLRPSAMHDLVRAYATTLSHDLPESVRNTALEREVDFYLQTACTASLLLEPHDTVIMEEPPAPGVRPRPLPDQSSAMAWLETEHSHLLAVQRTAAVHHRHHVVWRLAWYITPFHWQRGHPICPPPPSGPASVDPSATPALARMA